jgi:uncharacterized protein YqiB (DUF1249 family)
MLAADVACYIDCVSCDTEIVVSWRTRPRGLVALMGLYESNFLRLVLLAGDLRALPALAVSAVAGDCELRLAVHERARFTTDVVLTYLLPAAAPASDAPQRVPDLHLKIYHDARLVEASPDAARPERELHQSWSRNVMLNKWLEYCVDRGHRLG